MKLDKRIIDKLLKLNDEQLWSVIQTTACRSGLEKKLTKPNDMSKIRDTLKNIDEKDLDKVTELMKRGLENE